MATIRKSTRSTAGKHPKKFRTIEDPRRKTHKGLGVKKRTFKRRRVKVVKSKSPQYIALNPGSNAKHIITAIYGKETNIKLNVNESPQTINKWKEMMEQSVVKVIDPIELEISLDDKQKFDLLLIAFLDARHDFMKSRGKSGNKKNGPYKSLVGNGNENSFRAYLNLVLKPGEISKILPNPTNNNMVTNGQNNSRKNNKKTKLYEILEKAEVLQYDNKGEDIIVSATNVETVIQALIQSGGFYELLGNKRQPNNNNMLRNINVLITNKIVGKIKRLNSKLPLPTISNSCLLTQNPIYKIPRIAIDAINQTGTNPLTSLGIPFYGNLANLSDAGKHMSPGTVHQWLKTAVKQGYCNGRAVININPIIFKLTGFLSGKFFLQTSGKQYIKFNVLNPKDSIFNISTTPNSTKSINVPIASAGNLSNVNKNNPTAIVKTMIGKLMGDMGQSLGLLTNKNQANMFTSFDSLACMNHIYLSSLVGRFPAMCHCSEALYTFYYPTHEPYKDIYTALFKGKIDKLIPGTVVQNEGINTTKMKNQLRNPPRQEISKIYNKLNVNMNQQPTKYMENQIKNAKSNTMKHILKNTLNRMQKNNIDEVWKKNKIRFNERKVKLPKSVITQNNLKSYEFTNQTNVKKLENIHRKLKFNFVSSSNTKTNAEYKNMIKRLNNLIKNKQNEKKRKRSGTASKSSGTASRTSQSKSSGTASRTSQSKGQPQAKRPKINNFEREMLELLGTRNQTKLNLMKKKYTSKRVTDFISRYMANKRKQQ